MATIDYRDLLERLRGADAGARAPGSNAATLMFTGPVSASTVRKIACDADVIPVLLGGQGRILDIGLASRVFPQHIRKAITARDQGCAFPGCTIPASWTQANHVIPFAVEQRTCVDQGCLLCPYHHDLVDREGWACEMRDGMPCWTPPHWLADDP
jgi:hypothetical protein